MQLKCTGFMCAGSSMHSMPMTLASIFLVTTHPTGLLSPKGREATPSIICQFSQRRTMIYEEITHLIAC